MVLRTLCVCGTINSNQPQQLSIFVFMSSVVSDAELLANMKDNSWWLQMTHFRKKFKLWNTLFWKFKNYARKTFDLLSFSRLLLSQMPRLFIQVFYPSDDINVWTLAKLWFGVADSNIHHSAAHVGKNLSIWHHSFTYFQFLAMSEKLRCGTIWWLHGCLFWLIGISEFLGPWHKKTISWK